LFDQAIMERKAKTGAAYVLFASRDGLEFYPLAFEPFVHVGNVRYNANATQHGKWTSDNPIGDAGHHVPARSGDLFNSNR
jgi:hypothetical protein